MKENLKRIIIASVSRNGVIGNENKIPWRSKEELEHFKKTTIGNPVLMGRNTYESIGKQLPGRLNIVISKRSYSNKENLLFFNSVGNAYKFLRKNNFKKVFISGGSLIYKNVIKHADEMIISHMKFNSIGDKIFPNINLKLWQINKVVHYLEFDITYYKRKK